MIDKQTYSDLERKTRQLEEEVVEYDRKNKELKLAEFRHTKRTINLIKINEELNKEIDEFKKADKAGN
jgi:hypothetical protein